MPSKALVDFRPRKRFGQHFLHDQRVIARIIASIDPGPQDTLIEIGPGRAALTVPLAERVGALQLVEIDRDLAAQLRLRFAKDLHVTVHQADALAFDYCSLAGAQKLRIVGNLPYNISTPLLFHLLDAARCIQDMCFMLQKDVVRRIVAAPGNKDYGRLSVMIQWRCATETILDVGPGAFSPAPKVDSSVIRLVPHRDPIPVGDVERFSAIVRQAFSQRRKQLGNALKTILPRDCLVAAGIDPAARAEEISVAGFASLSRQCIEPGTPA